ncbi:hypothetical protein [Niastella caeni]|uniref:hypothetical protein n=1 Tax=Niastella caeni TaxID=2569763 RepID=UPI00129AD3F0|nr:hypothetical protein [Niastella caeni]
MWKIHALIAASNNKSNFIPNTGSFDNAIALVENNSSPDGITIISPRFDHFNKYLLSITGLLVVDNN